MQILKLLKPSPKKLIIIFILIIGGILVFNTFGRRKQAVLQLAQVKRQDIQSVVSGSGTLTGKESVNLKFKSSGKLAYINVKTGDIVSKGEDIAGLDTQNLAIALQQAQNTYRDKQALAEKAEDDVKDHSKDETFTQKATRTTAQAARDSAYDAVKEAQRAFSDAIITSPITGVITQAIDVSGQTVSATDLIAQVVDTSAMYFDTEVDEADIGSVTLGQEAEVSLNSYPDTIFTGVVSEILPSTKTTASNATVVIVRILLSSKDFKNIPGLNGQANIIYSKVKNALTIPSESIRDDNTVLVQEGSKLKSLAVTTGIKSDTDTEIKSGLKEGTQVVTNPQK